MFVDRTVFVASVALFAAVMTTAAQAQCGGCGYAAPAPVAYAPVYAPVVPQAYAPAVEIPVPVAAAPLAVDHWDTGGWAPSSSWGTGCGGCGCGSCGCGGCGGAAVGYAPASPLYVVNQGPEYSGPGFMVPFGTYSPGTGVAPLAAYPYVGEPGYHPYGYGVRRPYVRPYMRPYYARPYYRSRYVYHPYAYRRHYPYYRPAGVRG